MSPILSAARTLRTSQDRATAVLSVAAIALPHAVLLAVIAGVGMFQYRDEHPVSDMWVNGPHLPLAYFAATLLVIPALSMGAAAARLGVSRKAHTLATLRLIGISPWAARVAALLDTLVNAAIGVVVGSVLYALSLPAWRFVTFQGVSLGAYEMWMGVPLLLACAVLMLLLTAVSSVFAMQKVAITPLGVVRKNQRAKLNIVGVVLTVVLMLGWLVLSPIVIGLGVGIGLTILMILLGGMIAMMNVVGTFVVGLIGRATARFARTPEAVLAGRRLVADPKAVWRSFGALGFVAFVAGVVLPSLEIMSMMNTNPFAQEMDIIFAQDISTGVMLTMGISVVLASISTAIQQAIRAVDSTEQRHALVDMGAPASFWISARRKEVAYPALILIGGAVISGLIFISPLATITNPLSAMAGVVVLSIVALVVIMGAAESARLLERPRSL